MNEQELLELAGYDKPVSFCGQEWEIRPDGLAPLLRYAQAGKAAGLENETAALAAVHRFLEDCIINFPAFEYAALKGKADVEAVQEASHTLVSRYCARNYWPAMRLIGYASDNLEEMDGHLLRTTGRGIVSLSAREVCNLALATCLEGMDEEDRQFFIEDLNWEGSPEADALALVRQMQREQAAQRKAAAHAD